MGSRGGFARLARAGGLTATGALLLRPPGWSVALVGRVCRRVLFSVATKKPVVALSLDDGPHPVLTPCILDVLAEHRARATFFVIGSRAAAHPELVERIVGEGHELGNHTWANVPAWKMPPSALQSSLQQTAAVLPAEPAVELFRPGGGWFTPRVLRAAARCRYRCTLGSVYPLDGTVQLPRYARWDVLRRARPGAIVVLHEGSMERARVVWVLDQVLAELGRRGYRVTTISDLVAVG